MAFGFALGTIMPNVLDLYRCFATLYRSRTWTILCYNHIVIHPFDKLYLKMLRWSATRYSVCYCRIRFLPLWRRTGQPTPPSGYVPTPGCQRVTGAVLMGWIHSASRLELSWINHAQIHHGQNRAVKRTQNEVMKKQHDDLQQYGSF